MSRLAGLVGLCSGLCQQGVPVVIAERRIKLFRNGRNQAVRIPREFELPGEDAVMRRDGARLIIEAAAPQSLIALLATLEPLDEDFPEIPDPLAAPVDL